MWILEGGIILPTTAPNKENESFDWWVMKLWHWLRFCTCWSYAITQHQGLWEAVMLGGFVSVSNPRFSIGAVLRSTPARASYEQILSLPFGGSYKVMISIQCSHQ